jgi:DNA-directed RNA polymerase sigma subunit (sigma70/sigma32)
MFVISRQWCSLHRDRTPSTDSSFGRFDELSDPSSHHRAMADQAITRERIRQIASNTMSKLRHLSRSQVLRGYLD